MRAAALLLAVFLSAPLVAVEIEPGSAYPAGTRLEVAEYGVAFTVPDGWQATWPEGSEALLLRTVGDADVAILALGEAWSRAEAAAAMDQAIPLDGGIVLQPLERVGERGPALTGRYQVAGSMPRLEAYAEVVPGGHGIAAAFLLLAPPERLAAWMPAVRALADSTEMRAPAGESVAGGDVPAGGGGGGGNGDGGDRWDAYLQGKHIVRFYTTSGYTEEQHIWLCSDGTFYRSFGSGGFGGGASGAVASDSRGRWSATGAGANGRLVLDYADGTRGEHDLHWDYDANQLQVDGKRWLHDENEVCR